MTMLDTNEAFIVYIGRSDCKDCQAFQPILQEYLDEHQGAYIYYLDIKEYRDASRKENASSKEKEFYDNIYETFDIDWLPSLVLMNKDQIVSKYQYLDEGYYELSSKVKKQKQEEYKKEFISWMNEIFKEN